MDPISITSLLDGTRVALNAINELKRNGRHATADIASLARSLQSLMDVLDSIVRDNRTVIADIDRKHSPSFQALIAIGAKTWCHTGDVSILGRAVQDCSTTVAELTDILQKCCSSSSAKERLKGTLKWTLSKERTIALSNRLERDKATIQLGMESLGYLPSYSMPLSSSFVYVLTTTSYRSRNDRFMHFITTRTLEEQEERERTRIIDWLSTYDFEARHLDLQSLRLTGTFEWFRECDVYREWSTGTMRLLWLEGRSKY